MKQESIKYNNNNNNNKDIYNNKDIINDYGNMKA